MALAEHATTARQAGAHVDVATDPPERGDEPGGLLISVAILSALVGGIHLAVTQEHFEHWWVYGTFFVALGMFQVVFAAAIIRRPTWPAALTGITVNMAVVLVYVLSRTVGLPFAPEPEETSGSFHVEPAAGEVEGVGPLDLAATAGELMIVALLVTLLPPRIRRVTVNSLLVTGLLLWVMRFSGALG